MASTHLAPIFSFPGTTLLFLLLGLPSLLVTAIPAYNGSLTVPALYVLGDSLADVGNNNHLVTTVKADFPHNGIDFAGGKATGRFSNGKNYVDFLAEKLGLPSPPPYLSIAKSFDNSRDIFSGVNYASAGAGISDETDRGKCLSFNQQIDYLSTSYASMTKKAGDGLTQTHLARSIFCITIGSNDIFDYLKSNTATTPQQFVASLASILQGQLKRIYNIGARKFAFIGASPLGCGPSLRRLTGNESCYEVANSISDLYNQAASSVLQEMKSQLADINYSFFDSYYAFLEIMHNPSIYGFTEVKAACCRGDDLNVLTCIPTSSYCLNRTNHVFWDSIHPTEATARILSGDLFVGLAPHVFPINVRQLSSL